MQTTVSAVSGNDSTNVRMTFLMADHPDGDRVRHKKITTS